MLTCVHILKVVKDVVPEGVLVTVSSLGPLNVTALLGKRDLPKQYEVPPDLKESFQRQLLLQDFVPGREIKCAVLKVNQDVNPGMKYNLKLLFEDFGVLTTITDEALEEAVRNAEISDRRVHGDSADDYDDDDDDDGDDSEDISALSEEDEVYADEAELAGRASGYVSATYLL